MIASGPSTVSILVNLEKILFSSVDANNPQMLSTALDLLILRTPDLKRLRDILSSALLLSIDKNHEKIFDILVQKASVNNPFKPFPLHFAVQKGHLNIVKKLVIAGAKLENRDHNDFTPLQLSIIFENKEIFDFLLGAGADYEVISNGSIDIISLALRSNIDAAFIRHIKDIVGIRKEVLNKIRDTIQIILEEGFIQAEKFGKKPLIILGERHANFRVMQIEKQFLHVANKLGLKILFLENPSESVIEFSKELTEKKFATRSNFLRFAQEKLKFSLRGVDDCPNRETATLEERNSVIVSKLNEAGVLITGARHLFDLLSKIDPNLFYLIPFNLSCLNKINVIDILLNHFDSEGRFRKNSNYVIQISDDLSFSHHEQPLAHWNTQKSERKNEMNQKKIELDEQSLEKLKEDPETVLIFALQKKSLDLIRFSATIGADLKKEFFYCISANKIEDVQLLHQAGVDVNAKNDDGFTGLQIASEKGNFQMTQMLTQLGACESPVAEMPLTITVAFDCEKLSTQNHAPDQPVHTNSHDIKFK